MSVPAGFQPPIRADSYGHRPRNTLTCPNPKAVPRRPDERDHRARLTADRNIRRGTIQALQSPPDQPAARADDLQDDPRWPQLPMAHRWNSTRQGRGAAVSRTIGHRGDAALHLTPRPPPLANQIETSTQDDARALQTPQVRAHVWATQFGTHRVQVIGRNRIFKQNRSSPASAWGAGAQHRDLLAQHQQLGVLRRRGTCQQRHPADQADEHQIQHPYRHKLAMLPAS